MIMKMMQKKYNLTPREQELADIAEELLKQAEALFNLEEMEEMEEESTWI